MENRQEQLLWVLFLSGLTGAIGVVIAYFIRWWAGAPIIAFGLVGIGMTIGVLGSEGGGTPCP